jgi:hypothetical protein
MTPQDIMPVLWSSARDGLDAFGILAMALGMTASLMRRREAVLLTAGGSGGLFCIHYLGLGSATGAALCLISVGQNLSAALFARDRVPAWLGWAFAASALAGLCITLSTWHGLPSACACAGSLLATAGRLQRGPTAMRAMFAGATALWACHDLGVGSACALACEALTFGGYAYALVRGCVPARSRAKAGLAAA